MEQLADLLDADKPQLLSLWLADIEVNFNKVFYLPEKLREVSEINTDLETLEKELSNLESQLTL